MSHILTAQKSQLLALTTCFFSKKSLFILILFYSFMKINLQNEQNRRISKYFFKKDMFLLIQNYYFFGLLLGKGKGEMGSSVELKMFQI